MNDYEVFYTHDILNIEHWAEQCETEMFWLVDHQVSPFLDLMEDYWPDDETLIHNFSVLTVDGHKHVAGVRLVPKEYDTDRELSFQEVMGDWNPYQLIKAYTVEEALPFAKEYRFFVISPDVEKTSIDTRNYCTSTWQSSILNVTNYWQDMSTDGTNMGYGGVVLSNKDYSPDNIFFNEYSACERKPYDIVFMDYNEPFADENYAKLISRFPRAKRVSGVKGIYQAHMTASRIAETEMFWVVDADAIIDPTFKFDYCPSLWNRDTVHVWHSRNSVNGLEYGYGGVKLFPRKAFDDADENGVDVTTTVADKLIVVDTVSNVTLIDYDEFTAWKSAFRECAKLASSIIKNSNDNDNEERLNAWLNDNNESPFAKQIHQAATLGAEFGKSNPDILQLINDYDWIRQQYTEATK